MLYFRELYEKLKRSETEHGQLPEFNSHHLDCLLNPCAADDLPALKKMKQKLPKLFSGEIEKINEKKGVSVQIGSEKNTGFGSRDVACVLKMLHEEDSPVFALIAPAFISQFSKTVTPGKLRCAFKSIGFSGMIEVALFADILTLKEAFEFDRHILTDRDFLLTSCCCPIWIAMIRKKYHEFVSNIPPSVSPMIASGRSIKKICPDARTVFIGPCMAKKAEAKEPDIKDAVDCVLTFKETEYIFSALGINPEDCAEDLRDHSSTAGRIYARVGGVSRAVQSTVNRICPGRKIPLNPVQANGTQECKKLLLDLQNGRIEANFLEGMGCPGGCVGGPHRLVDTGKGISFVNEYGTETEYQTPIDNPYVIELLERLGYDTVESLLDRNHMFTRRFN